MMGAEILVKPGCLWSWNSFHNDSIKGFLKVSGVLQKGHRASGPSCCWSCRGCPVSSWKAWRPWFSWRTTWVNKWLQVQMGMKQPFYITGVKEHWCPTWLVGSAELCQRTAQLSLSIKFKWCLWWARHCYKHTMHIDSGNLTTTFESNINPALHMWQPRHNEFVQHPVCVRTEILNQEGQHQEPHS